METTTPNKLIYTGEVDIVQQTQKSLQVPMVLINVISDQYKIMPLYGREMTIQLDLVSRINELQAMNMYEQVCQDLLFINTTQGGTKIWWTRPSGGATEHDSEIRLFRIRIDLLIHYFDNSPE
jgi:hypothetical protein